ncbi:hypothetical protein [Streptomyces bicolor]|uniref:hypothetical protein n=1 Tax=Streptomyces bicolor TaxID=66874 RepID=UPI0009982461|nr:hypothetical protein [Streptomyces bicolor]
MTTEQTQTLLAMVAVLGVFVLLVLPSVIGIVHDRRIDRQIREAQDRDKLGAQKSSSRSTVPSTATWYAEGRRSKKLVSS